MKHAWNIYWDASSLLTSSRIHINDPLIKMLKKWLIVPLQKVPDSFCYALPLQESGQTKNPSFLLSSKPFMNIALIY